MELSPLLRIAKSPSPAAAATSQSSETGSVIFRTIIFAKKTTLTRIIARRMLIIRIIL